ncbi:hypothetical protein, partial [Xanthomonas sacchari]|uniref:hypothetical protein n=1 Tax=Xanthomonas sacchari TaxID=56458 RepID=UPI00225BCAD7
AGATELGLHAAGLDLGCIGVAAAGQGGLAVVDADGTQAGGGDAIANRGASGLRAAGMGSAAPLVALEVAPPLLRLSLPRRRCRPTLGGSRSCW